MYLLFSSEKMANHFSDKPHNPMLNAGAIMTSSLLLNLVHPDMKMSEKFDFVENYLRRISGGEFFRLDILHNRISGFAILH